MRLTLAACLIVVSVGVAGAQSACDGSEKQSLGCYAETHGGQNANPVNEYPLVDEEDLYANPRRYIGHHIRVSGFQCFAALADEYRCFPDNFTPVVVFAKSVATDVQRASLDANCSTVKASHTPLCRRDFDFLLLSSGQDQPSALAKRTVLYAEVIFVE